MIDGDNLAHRAYHSVPKSVRGPDGRPINAIVGWSNMLLALWDAEQPRAVFVAWDTLGVPTYRHELWPDYQGGREFDDAIVAQLGLLPGVSAAFGCGVGQQAGYEADDLIASAVAAETRRGGTCLVLTTDRDAYQIVTDAVTVLAPRKGITDLARIGPAEVVERLGVPPEQVGDFKAIAGDASDNIPGARGIGPKGAAALLAQYSTLEGVLAARAEEDPRLDSELLRRFRKIVQVRSDAPVELPDTGPLDWRRASEALSELGAASLSRRVAERAEGASSQPSLGM